MQADNRTEREITAKTEASFVVIEVIIHLEFDRKYFRIYYYFISNLLVIC